MSRDSWDFVIKDRLDEIEEWISNNVAEYSVCQKLGIHPATWIEQKKRHPELNELIIRARSSGATLVLNAQARAASGHTVRLLKQKVGKDGTIYDTYEEVYYPPNPQAAEFWGRHIMPDYVAPRSDAASAVTVNVQLPQIQADIARLTQARQALEQELAVIDVAPESQESQDPQEPHTEDRTDTSSKQDAAGAQTDEQADEQADEHDPF